MPRRTATLAAIGTLAVAAALTPSAPALAAPVPAPKPAARAARSAALPVVGPWKATRSYLVSSVFQNQGLATVRALGGSHLWYTGNVVAPDAQLKGWNHVGDPDFSHGYVVEPYQSGAANPTSKMFRVYDAAHGFRSSDFVHRLVPGEAMNNSFAAVSPDGRWLVSGEWETQRRLLITPMPRVNRAAADPARDLPLTGRVVLDRAVRDVQGCDFTTATRLLCSSDDAEGIVDGVVRPLLQIDLAHAPDGRDVAGRVTALGPLPTESACKPDAQHRFETEGIDYDAATGVLRVEVVQPGLCIPLTTVWEFDGRTVDG
ncbi:hypothetical protein DZF91_18615 [Actinomadura logoneensis]|uniref:Secreted protein n=1 Tax=Actinomadura logoneensis TaxID=2293572 RepID=A0A372JJM9_9ACTN|nr:hypothetical protein [Actinomadura logoneensis]RFU40150.1 hypothetical protein DZF91_18615 [Actinomadura logoneensis]